MTTSSRCSTSQLGLFLESAGGGFHPNLCFVDDPHFGLSVHAETALPAGEAAVSCPFSLAITPSTARRCLAGACLDASSLTNREAMISYLCFHKIFSPSTAPQGVELLHGVYVDSLPAAETLRTPLYYSDAEMDLLMASNLHGATTDRQKQWKDEWESLLTRLTHGVDAFTWELYLWASTMLSSRAFPSSLIDGDTSDEALTPILFPGIDALNHQYGKQLSWNTDVHSPTGEIPGKMSVVLDEEVAAGEQVFNTYGAKPNEELLLGYGFTTPSNAGDVVALKLSLPPYSPSLSSTLSKLGLSNLRHFVPRSGVLPPELFAQMRLLVADKDERDELDAKANAIPEGGSRGDLLDFRPTPSSGSGRVRPEVRAMVQEYRQGQVDVLEKALEYRDQLQEQTIQKALEAGVNFDFEDEEYEGEA
ncbi:lysine methyltransferase [Pseudohyphozyma bogoriensis]|nr:lysine methyltransferase [Pseudohyphozyma bogoriensis]